MLVDDRRRVGEIRLPAAVGIHVQFGEKTFNWYVFNLADVAIVVGVAALLYDSFRGPDAVKAP